MPRFSIIVPIYNIETYLDSCLDSLQKQSFSDFEVLCVIDGSSDGSTAIAQAYAQKDARFKVLTKANGGLSSARNFGIDKAQGDILLFVDGDDTLEARSCEHINRAFEQTNPQVLVFGARVVPPENNTPWFDECFTPPQKTWDNFSESFMFAPFATPFVWRNAVLRKTLEETKLRFDENLPFGEDVVFQFALYPRCERFASIPQKLYNYKTERSGSLMDEHKSELKRLKAHHDIVETVLKDWEQLGIINTYIEHIFNWSIHYLTRGIENISPDKAKPVMQAANCLLERFFGEGYEESSARANTHIVAKSAATQARIKHPMNIHTNCLCRGDGKLYLLVRAQGAAPYMQLSCRAFLDGNKKRPIPINAYDFSRAEQIRNKFHTEQEWVLEIPELNAQSVLIECEPDTRSFERSTFSLSYKRAKWISRLNYRRKTKLCAQIRDIERKRTKAHYQCSVNQRFKGDAGTLWHCSIVWQGANDARPSLRAYDAQGEALEIRTYFCELQEASDIQHAHTLLMSVETPADCNFFLLEAFDRRKNISSPSRIHSGFALIDPKQAEQLENETKQLMSYAGKDQACYDAWFKSHRFCMQAHNNKATEEETETKLLNAQPHKLMHASSKSLRDDSSAANLANSEFIKPWFFLVLVISDQTSTTDVKRTLAGLRKQNYEHFSLHILAHKENKSALQEALSYCKKFLPSKKLSYACASSATESCALLDAYAKQQAEAQESLGPSEPFGIHEVLDVRESFDMRGLPSTPAPLDVREPPSTHDSLNAHAPLGSHKSASDKSHSYEADTGKNKKEHASHKNKNEHSALGFVALLATGDELEPSALSQFEQAASETHSNKNFLIGKNGNPLSNINPNLAQDTTQTPKLIYCDEDTVSYRKNKAHYAKPRFKSKLNIDMQYTHNWIGQFCAFDLRNFTNSQPSLAKSPAAWLYEQTLAAYARGTHFFHVPYMLFHRGGNTAEANCSAAHLSNMQEVLQAHLKQRGIPCSIQQENTTRTLHVNYLLPHELPLVSIIIPNKDHIELLKPCLESIFQKASYSSYEIIVVENNSTQAETFRFYDEAQKVYPRLRVINWEHEFNYSRIVNFGAQHARGQYLLFLNNDTQVITPNFIEEMLGQLQRPEMGLVGAKLLFADGLTQHAGVCIGPWNAVVHVNQFFTRTQGGYLNSALLPGQFSAVTGACQLISARLFAELKGYNENFAVGFNDIDFCLRVQEIGKLVSFCPTALLYHFEFASRGREEVDPQKQARWEKEREQFMRRWPFIFEEGDPYSNPNLGRDNTYYRISS